MSHLHLRAVSAQAMVNWLEAHGHRDLVARSVTVINGVKSRLSSLDLDAVQRFFSRHTQGWRATTVIIVGAPGVWLDHLRVRLARRP